MYNIQRGPDRGPHEHQDPDQKQEAMDNSKPSQSTTKDNGRYEDSMESESATPPYISYGSHSYWQTQDLPKSYPQSSNSGVGQQFPSAERPWECNVIGCAADVQTWVAESGLKRHQKMWHGPHACEIMGCPRSAPNGFGSATELQQHKSNEHYLIRGPLIPYADNLTISNLVDAVANTSLQPGNEIDNESGQARIIKRNPGDNSQAEIFNPSYKLHMARDFKFGRVFKILWSEPRGAGGTQISQRVGKWGQMFNEKVRRFVIIDCRKGHCICLPIMTYGGQGCLKKGVHAEDHAIIYTSPQPAEFAGEGMRKKPIKVKLYSPQHKLEPASRLNYAKVYTVEYNVKVWFIGEIHKDSEWWFTTDYNETHPLLRPRGNPPISDGSSSYQHQDVGAGSSGAQMSSWAGGLQYASVPQTGISMSDPYASSHNYPTSTTGTTQAPDYSRADPDALLASNYSPSWQTYQESTQMSSYSRRDNSNPGEYQSPRSTLTPSNLDYRLYGA